MIKRSELNIGTAISPIVHNGVRARTLNGRWITGQSLFTEEYKIYGKTEDVDYGECYCVDTTNYTGTRYWIVPLSELIRIGIVEDDSLPNEWWYKVESQEELDAFKQTVKAHPHHNSKFPSVQYVAKKNDGQDWGYNTTNSYEHYPQLSKEQFYSFIDRDVKESFVLPEKWCIKGCPELKAWATAEEKKGNSLNMIGDTTYFYYFPTSGLKIWQCEREMPEGYSIITPEQFKQITSTKQTTLMSKTISFKHSFLVEAYEAANTVQKRKLKENTDAILLTTTDTFIKEMHTEACDGWKKKIEAEFPDLFKKTTYKVGQKFKYQGDNSICMLCQVDNGNLCALIVIAGDDTGNRWKTPIKVSSLSNITEEELADMISDYKQLISIN